MSALALLALVACGSPPTIDKDVVDAANVLDANEESDLAAEVKKVRAEGAQLAVLLVTSTDGVPIEDYANDAANAWGGGSKAEDNGVLLVIATQDRKVRLEVGDGVQAIVPDSEAARLIDMASTSLRRERWREGAGIIVNGLASRFDGARRGLPPPKEDQTVQGMLTLAGLVAGLVGLVMLAMFARARFARRRTASLPYAGAERPGDDALPFTPNLPPEGAGNAFAGQLAREREEFQKDPENTSQPLSRGPTFGSSSSPLSSTSRSSASSSPSSPSSSNGSNKGGGGSFGGGGASGSF
jgi:uncharacterized protein